MRWVKKIVTSVVVINLTVVITYILANLLLAFSQELVRVYKLFKETNDIATLTEFRQSYLTAFEYQQDYQLYYVAIGILAGIGLLSGVIKIFTELYPPKTNFRKRVEQQRKEYADSVKAGEVVEGRNETGETTKRVEVEQQEVKPVSVQEVSPERIEPEEEVDRDAIISGILKEAEERKKRNQEIPDEGSVDTDEFNEDGFGEFELVRSSPDRSFEGLINGEEVDSEYKEETLS